MSDQLSGKSAVSSSAAVCPPAQHADPATADKQQTSLQQLMERCEAADECDAINTAYATFLHRQPAQARWASQRESKLTQMKLRQRMSAFLAMRAGTVEPSSPCDDEDVAEAMDEDAEPAPELRQRASCTDAHVARCSM